MVNAKRSSEPNKPVRLNRLLNAVFDQKEWRAKLELHRVFDIWDSTVGPDISAVAQPSLIRGRVLWVKVADSVWMQQLHLQKILLLEKINKRLAKEQIADIHFQLNSSTTPPAEAASEEAKPVPLDPLKEREFDKLISSLDNEALRTSLKNLWIKIQTKG